MEGSNQTGSGWFELLKLFGLGRVERLGWFRHNQGSADPVRPKRARGFTCTVVQLAAALDSSNGALATALGSGIGTEADRTPAVGGSSSSFLSLLRGGFSSSFLSLLREGFASCLSQLWWRLCSTLGLLLSCLKYFGGGVGVFIKRAEAWVGVSIGRMDIGQAFVYVSSKFGRTNLIRPT